MPPLPPPVDLSEVSSLNLSVIFTARRYASAVCAMLYVRPSVWPSDTCWFCIETTERIEPVYGTKATSAYLAYAVLRGNSGISINKDSSVWNLSPGSSTWPIFLLFRHSTLIVASVTNFVRPSQVHHTERPRLFTTR